MRILHLMMILLFSLLSFTVIAEPLPREQVPEPLQPWVDWVLQDNHQLNCPYYYNEARQSCHWPSKLNLQLNNSGGSFSQEWQVFGETQVQLPGEAKHWPQRVRNESGELLLVRSDKGFPYIELDAGRHTIRGEFHWQNLPKSLRVTPESGLISLRVNGKSIEQPRFNQQGQLWLTQGKLDVASEDNLDIQVFRKIIDSHPVQVSTIIKLRVSGKQRNTTLDSVLLRDFIAQKIISRLPVRLGSTNTLQLQLRPGEWTVEVIGRAVTDVTEFVMPEIHAPWPKQEIWVYQANTGIRQAKVVGPASIDPGQTRLPEPWKTLPTYIMAEKQKLTLDVSHRGVPDTGRDELVMHRQMWLDYDGEGYTLKDSLTGTLAKAERLNVLPELQLGRVSIDGMAQYITHGNEDSQVGVEIRRSNVSLTAESRFTGDRSTPPVNGWQQDLSEIWTTLHLPSGWRLLAASGTDNVPDSWMQNWSLLDLFLVLIIAISVAYLYGALWAVFTLISLVFIWHEPGAPRYIWLNLLALVALLRVLPESRFRQMLHIYRGLSLLWLVLLLLPYTIDTIRFSLYPQLEYGYYNQHRYNDLDTYSADNLESHESGLEIVEQVSSSRISKKMLSDSYTNNYELKVQKQARHENLQAIDPDSKVQTGFGLPSWQGVRPISLYWSGPVKGDESSRLLLIGPLSNLIIRWLGILFLLILSWRMTSLGRELLPKPFVSFKLAAPAIMVLCLSPLLVAMPSQGQAESLPDEKMLSALRDRLIQAPDCLPNCVQIETMKLIIDGGAMQIRLRAHAAISSAIPLPGRQGLWLAQQVLVDGEPAAALQRDHSQHLWLALEEGLHDIVLRGPLPQRNSVAIPLPLKPHHFLWQSLDDNWTLEGAENNAAPESQLQINRISKQSNKADLDSESVGTQLPAFVKIERYISLGLDWKVQTIVTRIAPENAPISLSVPLIDGEQVMSDSLSIKNRRIKIGFSSKRQQMSWESRLDISKSIKLIADNNPNYLESWHIAVSPVWHIQREGIPINAYPSAGQSEVSVWKPWPGETLQLDISRPAGVEGQTVTILGSHLTVSPGKRANDVALKINVLSSRGVAHDIVLPEGAEVQTLTVANQVQRIRQVGDVLSIALLPGKQEVVVEWRDENALGARFKFPKLNLGLPSVNAWFNISLPSSRWVVWVSGPTTGPVILFWGVLLALFILSLGLGRSKITPLKTWQWFLLGIGLSQTETTLMVVVVGWLVAISLRQKQTKPMSVMLFNLMQAALVGVSLIALGVLAVAVGNGLLGSPDMQIVGNGSSSHLLNWYQDRSTQILPQPQIISVPLWIYRTLMLLWALWLAKSVVGWLRWEWTALNVGGLWKKKSLVETEE